MEEVIEALLMALRTDTVVRWSAAKGLGRHRSPPAELGDEVVGSISSVLLDGGRFDLARRLPALAEPLVVYSFPIVFPTRYPRRRRVELRRAPRTSLCWAHGETSRDVWAFAQPTRPMSRPHADALAPSLLVTACFDREVNCRRCSRGSFRGRGSSRGVSTRDRHRGGAVDYLPSVRE